MRKWEQKKLVSYDPETGEVLDYAMVAVGRRIRWKENYLMTFQDKIEELARDEELTGRTWRVLAALLGKLGWENWLHVNQSDLARELNLHRTDISKNIKLLVEKGVIIRGPKMGRSNSFKLNSNYGFKGKLTDLSSYRMKERHHLHLVRDGEPAADPDQPTLFD